MSIITLSKAECKDCHRCVRNCSVKAIGINNGQAEVVTEKCIYCGECVVTCPQDAKGIKDDSLQLKEILKSKQVVASIAPSFVATIDCEPGQFIAALKRLGFKAVEPTAKGAEIIAEKYKQLLLERNKPLISACCPSIVNLIEKYYPSLLDYISPTVSPMIAHGKLLKKKYPNSKIVFIGPCIAKIDEIKWSSSQQAIDLAITFNQLENLLSDQNLSFNQLPNQQFDNFSSSWASAFPIQNGILKAANVKPDLGVNFLSVSGLNDCINTFQDLLNEEIEPKFIEAMACAGGCISGPGINSNLGINARRERVVRYTHKNSFSKQNKKSNLYHTNIDINRRPNNRKMKQNLPTENQIRTILSQIGKFKKTDEIDCGGCGYNSCREKAIAVYQGLAELRMCIPYMKDKLESLADIIVKNSPNAIIVVNKDMTIQKFNPKANEIFNRHGDNPLGKKLFKYVDPSPFLESWEQKKSLNRKKVEYKQYDVVVEESIIPLIDYELVVAVMTDVTKQEEHKKEVAKMKETTLEKATQVINKQMQVAQEIAGLLGESTSETKAILYEVTELMQKEEH